MIMMMMLRMIRRKTRRRRKRIRMTTLAKTRCYRCMHPSMINLTAVLMKIATATTPTVPPYDDD